MKRWKWIRLHRVTIDRVTSMIVTLSMVMSLMPSQGIAWAQDQLTAEEPVSYIEEVPEQTVVDESDAATAQPEELTGEVQDTASPADQRQTSTSASTDAQDAVEYGNLKISLALIIGEAGHEAKSYRVTIQDEKGLYLNDKGEWIEIIWPKDIQEQDKDALMPEKVMFVVSQTHALDVQNLPVGTYTVSEVMDDTIGIDGFELAAGSVTGMKNVYVSEGKDTEVKLQNVYQRVVVPDPESVVEVVEPEPAEAVPAEEAVPVEEVPTETEVAPAETEPETEPSDDEQPEAQSEAQPEAQPEATEATDETPASDTPQDEEPAPEANTQSTFIYEDADVRVTAELDDPSVVPAGVKLVVVPVTPADSDYNYGAYLKALNGSVKGNPYNDKNTLLYDVSFQMVDKDGKTVEVEPAEGTVEVTFRFKQDQLADDLDAKNAADVDVTHLPETDDGIVAEAVDTKAKGTNQIQMTVAGFSVYAFSYTVDFTFDGFTYSIAGESSILLSKLFEILGIDANIDNVNSVTFTDPKLVEVKQVSGDWMLTSLKPFDTEETLTVEMFSGAKYVIQVTDAQQYTYTVRTYAFDGTETGVQGLSNYYVRALIKDKNNNYVAGDIKPIDLSSSPATVTLSFYSNPWGTHTPYSYDPTKETLEIRVVHPNDQYYNPLEQGNWALVQEANSVNQEAPDGYAWRNGIIGATSGSVELVASKPVQYNVRVQFDADANLPAGSEELYVLATIEHATTNETTYGLAKVSTGTSSSDDGVTYFDIPITQWYNDAEGTAPKEYKFTGNEKKCTVTLVAKSGNTFYEVPLGAVVNDSTVTQYPSTENPGSSMGRTVNTDNPSVDMMYDTVIVSKTSGSISTMSDYSLA